MRTVILDTETTGLSPKTGHRIIEIGCVELIDRIETGNIFHTYINPDRNIPDSSTKIHGITDQKVANKPKFNEIADSFLNFIDNSKLIIHNAPFDIGFLNFELAQAKYNQISSKQVIDTLPLARQKFPGSPASLDALCKRFNISLENRKYHGALLDSQLLASVYLELTAKSQSSISFQNKIHENKFIEKKFPRNHQPSSQEIKLHEEMLQKIKETLWKKRLLKT